MQEDAERTIREWEDNLKREELAEKRRVAPGWLDREEKILQPAKAATDNTVNRPEQSATLMDQQTEETSDVAMQQPAPSQEGDELDRAFGGLTMR